MNKLSGIELLRSYTHHILEFERVLMKQYNLTKLPYISLSEFPRRGILQVGSKTYEYNFHGSGCTFSSGVIEVNYDAYIDRDNYLIASPWKFMTFIKTLSDNIDLTEEEALKILEKLAKDGFVNKIYDNYSVYEIDTKKLGFGDSVKRFN